MKGVVMHWTGGTHKVSSLDKKHYHSIFAGNGTRVIGDHTREDNENTSDGIYAAHTYHMNTNFVGVSIACMGGGDVKERPLNYGKYPPTKKQVKAMCKHVALLCDVYGINITRKTILCHGEVQKNLGIKQRGKWDINCLPWIEKYGNTHVGDYLRRQVSTELEMLRSPDINVTPAPVDAPKPKPQKNVGAAIIIGSGVAAAGALTFWEKISNWIEGLF